MKIWKIGKRITAAGAAFVMLLVCMFLFAMPVSTDTPRTQRGGRNINDPIINRNGSVTWGSVYNEPFAADFDRLDYIFYDDGEDFPTGTGLDCFTGYMVTAINREGRGVDILSWMRIAPADFQHSSYWNPNMVMSLANPVAEHFYREINFNAITGTTRNPSFREHTHNIFSNSYTALDGATLRVDITMTNKQTLRSRWIEASRTAREGTLYFSLETIIHESYGPTSDPTKRNRVNMGVDPIGNRYQYAGIFSPGAIIRLEKVDFTNVPTRSGSIIGTRVFSYTAADANTLVANASLVGYFMLSDSGTITISGLPNGFYRVTLVRAPLGFTKTLHDISSVSGFVSGHPIFTGPDGNPAKLLEIGMIIPSVTRSVEMSIIPRSEWCNDPAMTDLTHITRGADTRISTTPVVATEVGVGIGNIEKDIYNFRYLENLRTIRIQNSANWPHLENDLILNAPGVFNTIIKSIAELPNLHINTIQVIGRGSNQLNRGCLTNDDLAALLQLNHHPRFNETQCMGSGLNLMISLPNVTDISVLTGLTNLRSLELRSTRVSDFSPLAHMPDLQSFTIRSPVVNVTDLSHLTGNQNLRTLIIDSSTGPRLSNQAVLNSISGLTGLTRLTITTNSSGTISDLTPLAGLTNLTELHIGRNQITDLTPLAGLTNLTRLTITDNNITDLSPLRNLSNLVHLDLMRNPNINDWSPVQHIRTVRGRPAR
jgi:hypothetical protein